MGPRFPFLFSWNLGSCLFEQYLSSISSLSTAACFWLCAVTLNHYNTFSMVQIFIGLTKITNSANHSNLSPFSVTIQIWAKTKLYGLIKIYFLFFFGRTGLSAYGPVVAAVQRGLPWVAGLSEGTRPAPAAPPRQCSTLPVRWAAGCRSSRASLRYVSSRRRH